MMRMIDCIYCCKAGAHSREHVLQASLGGNLTAEVACDSCNHSFSQIDQALAEQSFVAMERIVQTPVQRSVRLGNMHFIHRADDDIWQEVQVTNRLVPRVPAQLHFRDPHAWLFAGTTEDKHHFATLLQKRIANCSVLTTPIRIGPERYCTTARLVQHRRANMFVRARSLDEGKDFLALLPRLWSEVQTAHIDDTRLEKIESPTIHIHLSMCLDDIYRAVAKTAFNYLALRKGIPFARRSEFDPIRRYILGHDIQHPSQLRDDEVAVDTRFVSAWERGEQFLVPTTKHLIMLGYLHPNVFGAVTLYGKRTFMVHLGEVEFQSIMDFVPEAHEFSIDGTHHQALDMFEIVARMHG